MQRAVERHGAGSARRLLEALVALAGDAGNGERGELLDDDVTVVVVKRR